MRTIAVRGLAYDVGDDDIIDEVGARWILECIADRAGLVRSDAPPIIRFERATREAVEAMWSNPVAWTNEPGGASLPEVLSTAGADFPVDLPTVAFLMLTRWEEANRIDERDEHGRVPTRTLFAFRNGFHRRPIIDEWALRLRAQIRRVRPQLLGDLPKPRLFMTHDVDRPLRFPTVRRVLRGAAGELLARSGRATQAIRQLGMGMDVLAGRRADPYAEGLGQLLALDERLDTAGAFFFMSSSGGPRDEGYDPARAPYSDFIAEIQRRGHEIGWHPGWSAAFDDVRFAAEKQHIDAAAGHPVEGGRHHYLRWDVRSSWDRWDGSGLRYDSSLGFDDDVGFRAGTAHPYPVYSLATRRVLRLIERPLIVMDVALRAAAREDLSEARRVFAEVLRAVGNVRGEAVVLVHNSWAIDFPAWFEMMRDELLAYRSRSSALEAH